MPRPRASGTCCYPDGTRVTTTPTASRSVTETRTTGAARGYSPHRLGLPVGSANPLCTGHVCDLGYATTWFDDEHMWEWQVVYEFRWDVSSCTPHRPRCRCHSTSTQTTHASPSKKNWELCADPDNLGALTIIKDTADRTTRGTTSGSTCSGPTPGSDRAPGSRRRRVRRPTTRGPACGESTPWNAEDRFSWTDLIASDNAIHSRRAVPGDGEGSARHRPHRLQSHLGMPKRRPVACPHDGSGIGRRSVHARRPAPRSSPRELRTVADSSGGVDDRLRHRHTRLQHLQGRPRHLQVHQRRRRGDCVAATTRSATCRCSAPPESGENVGVLDRPPCRCSPRTRPTRSSWPRSSRCPTSRAGRATSTTSCCRCRWWRTTTGQLVPDTSVTCADDDDTACLAWRAGTAAPGAGAHRGRGG